MGVYGNFSCHLVQKTSVRLNYSVGVPMIPSFPPDSILICVLFPSHREGLGMGFQNGMGVWGKGQLEHVSDG